MFKSIATLSAIAGFAPLVAAHGWVRSVKIDGVLFEGRTPNTDFDKPTPIRQIDTVNPVKGAETRAMNCGSNATPSTFSAEANPGSVLEFDWAGGDGGKWPHNTGPMITYMASCGAGGCVNFDPIDADFFKIDQQGKRDDGVWVQQELFDGGVARVTLPTTLPEGEYLVRHEVIGLHIASNFQGAEFYPSCTAIKLSAPTNPAIAKLPSGAETVRFPGAYRDDDPGILLNVFNGQPYTQFPGPAVADFGGAPAQDSPVTDGPAVIDTPPVDAPPVEAPPATGGGNNGGNNCNGGVQKRGLPDRRTHVQRLRDFRDHLAARAAERGLGESDYFGAKMKREPTRPYVMSRYFRNLN